MAGDMRGMIKENIIVGAALGLLTLMAALLSVFADSKEAAFERASLPSPSSTIVAAERVDDPAFHRVYTLRSSAGTAYGVVFSERSRDSSAIFGAVFSPKGELRELKILGSCAARLPEDAREALDSLDEQGQALDRAAKAVQAVAEAD
jgi:hypothetical protein